MDELAVMRELTGQLSSEEKIFVRRSVKTVSANESKRTVDFTYNFSRRVCLSCGREYVPTRVSFIVGL
jgi:hypothetical protein